MTDFAKWKLRYVDLGTRKAAILDHENGSCAPASMYEAWAYAEIERLRAALKVCAKDFYLDEYNNEYKPTHVAIVAQAALNHQQSMSTEK